MSSYRDIFKSSLFMGGQQVAKILINIVQGKVNAILLGTAGTGIIGVYSSLFGMVQSVTGLGIATSGARQVAVAARTGGPDGLARGIRALRYTCLVLGAAGMLGLLLFSAPLGRLSFHDPRFSFGVAILAPSLLFAQVWTGHMAVMQGLRRIREMSIASVAGAALAASLAITLVYFFRENGIAPSFTVGWAASLLCSWLLVRRMRRAASSRGPLQVWEDVRELVRVGFALMVTSLAGALAAYALRAIIVRRLGIDAVGLYQAGWTLSTFYVGMVLQAMGADFLPRLTAATHDRSQMNRLVNEQVEMGAFMAAPGALAMIVFVPWLIRLFYTSDFVPAASLTRWMGLGIAFRVVSWPLSYVQVALGRGRLMIVTELSFHMSVLALSALCMACWGLDGIGMGLLGSYLPYTLGTYVICGRLTGFQWSRPAFRAILFLLVSVGGGFLVTQTMQNAMGLLVGLALTATVTVVGLLGLPSSGQRFLWGIAQA
jgi:enterobacterial common antigen flippase